MIVSSHISLTRCRFVFDRLLPQMNRTNADRFSCCDHVIKLTFDRYEIIYFVLTQLGNGSMRFQLNDLVFHKKIMENNFKYI